jgi:hypothetical protein
VVTLTVKMMFLVILFPGTRGGSTASVMRALQCKTQLSRSALRTEATAHVRSVVLSFTDSQPNSAAPSISPRIIGLWMRLLRAPLNAPPRHSEAQLREELASASCHSLQHTATARCQRTSSRRSDATRTMQDSLTSNSC